MKGRELREFVCGSKEEAVEKEGRLWVVELRSPRRIGRKVDAIGGQFGRGDWGTAGKEEIIIDCSMRVTTCQ